MKKKRELTKKEEAANLRFLRRVPAKIRKHKKLINGRVTKEDLILLISALWKGFSKIKIRRNGITKRRYKNIPPFGRLHKYSHKVLTGIYGSHIELARKEGLV